MKEIRAIVRPSRLNRLRDALRAIPNFPGVTIFRAEGFTAPAAVDKRSVREELTDFSPKLMVSVLAQAEMVETIRQAITQACQTVPDLGRQSGMSLCPPVNLRGFSGGGMAARQAQGGGMAAT